VKAELPRLVEMAGRVAGKHGWRDARLAEVHQTVIALAEEMFSHMRKEELIFFPSCARSRWARRMAVSTAGPLPIPLA
jgi:iron-sulfur cluster repair protein YtfE (RIC family)